MDSTDGDRMFGPLKFEENTLKTTETQCLLCKDIFNLLVGFDIFVGHLFQVHKIIIEDIQKIENISGYIDYWRDKLKESNLEEIIPSVEIDSSGEKYYVLSTLLKEDRELRHKLRLEYALKVQEYERTDSSYIKQCLFCRLVFEGTRQGFLEHLYTRHNLHLGNPQNLVYIEELINKLEEKLNELKCIYCDKIFVDRPVLKEHMRKKLHKKINERNSEYDRFFIVNYLESGKNWRSILKEQDRDVITNEQNTDEEYNDWLDDKGDLITCLLCDKKEININTLCLHMDADHEFDFVELTKSFDFYQKVKLVNYIRKQMHNNACLFCNKICDNLKDLQQHLSEEQHYKLPDIKIFDQPEYYFPTYENDSFLYLIDDVED